VFFFDSMRTDVASGDTGRSTVAEWVNPFTSDIS